MSQIDIELLLNRDLNTKEEFRLLFSIWQNVLPKFIPQKYGYGETPKHPFDVQCPEEPLDSVGHSVTLFRTRKPKLRSYIGGRRPGAPKVAHSIWHLTLDSEDVTSQEILSLLAAGSAQLGANFAWAHIGNDYDFARGQKSFTAIYLDAERKKPFVMLGAKVHEYLGDLYWCTVFGPPYVQLFGEEHILQTPAYSVRRLQDGLILVQLTEQITESIANPAHFEKIRNEAKDHLNHNAFFDLNKPSGSQYNIPEFGFR